MNKIIKYLFLSVLALSLTSTPGCAQDEHEATPEERVEQGEHHDEAVTGHESFNAGKMIIEHVADAHSIHFFNTTSFHATVPLPCIVYGPNGLDIFMSGNLFNCMGAGSLALAATTTV